MSQIFEALRKAEALQNSNCKAKDEGAPFAERRRSGRRSIAAKIRIYGHGQGAGPFFEENSVINASATGALLLLKTSVVAGQRILLINEAAERAQECRVVRTCCCGAQELEVAVEFPGPQPEFWARLDEPSNRVSEKRRHSRVILPRGMSITWRGGGESVVARVQTISAGGISIASPRPAASGELLRVRFEVPSGEVAADGIVRHSHAGEGMGVEFLDVPREARTRLDHLLEKLLA